MELPKTNLLECPEETVQFLRKEYNLDKPGRIDEAIDILEIWIRKQQHFIRKDFSRKYLEKLIIYNKGSIERAKSRLDKACTLRTELSIYLEILDPRIDFKDTLSATTTSILEKLTSDHCRVVICKLHTDFQGKLMHGLIKYLLLAYEFLNHHDYSNNTLGLLHVEANVLDMVTSLNPIDFQHGMALCMECIGRRFKGLHILTTSKSVDALVKLFKTFFPAKIADRVHAHKTMDTVYEYIPKEVLPECYGGCAKVTPEELNDKWLEVLSSKEVMNYVKNMNTYRVNELLRMVDKGSLTGTFRNLSVD